MDDATGAGSDGRKLILAGVAVGSLYGLALRALPHFFPAYEAPFVMTASFTCLMPFAMGFLTVYVAEARQRRRWWIWILLPWLPLAAALAGTVVMLLEGYICVVMFAPVGMVLASAGGLLGGLASRLWQGRRGVTASCVAALPLLFAPWEGYVLHRLDVRTVENVIDIHAPADVVWSNIKRVPAIRADELPTSWSHRIGFPNPVEATLSWEGVGGVRHATFEGGVLFIETVDVWEQDRRLAFSIQAQTDQIPKTTLDDHVTIGGPYFDVLRGEYGLEPMGDGITRLHLSSRHRVSTDFNWYAHLWTDAVMSDLQKRILFVVRARCEPRANLAR